MSDKERTQGAAIVAGLVRRIGASAISHKLEPLTEGAIRAHASGSSLPRAAARGLYLDAYNIPVEAWTSPACKPTPVMPKAHQRSSVVRISHDASGPETDNAMAAVVDLLRVARSELGRAQADTEVPYSARAQLITSATGLCRLLARLSGQLEVTESQVVRSAPFRRAMAILEGALEPHTAAARDVARALEAFGEL